MQIKITGRHVDVTEAMKAHVEDGIHGLMFNDVLIEAHAILTVEKHRHECEIHGVGKDFDVTVKDEEEKDMYKAIDLCLKKMGDQLKKRHDRFKKRRAKDHQAKEQEKEQQFTIDE